MRRYQSADSAAAGELIERLSPGLLRFFTMQQLTRLESEDLVQETWLRIHRVRHTYRPDAPVLPWIFAIARNVRVDGFRKRHRIQRNELAMEVLPEPRRASERNASASDSPSFEVLMKELPESQQEVLILLKVNGLTLEETAAAMHLTVGAVKQKASRAYAKLRVLLQGSHFRRERVS